VTGERFLTGFKLLTSKPSAIITGGFCFFGARWSRVSVRGCGAVALVNRRTNHLRKILIR